MAQIIPSRLPVGSDQRPIAVVTRAGQAPGLFWLGGFRSDMTGSKAMALDAYGAQNGLAVTRFDYSGHGASGGNFNVGTISRWLEEALAVFDQTQGAQVVVGSSMGGWIALLLAKALRNHGQTGRLKGMVLIAPAVDMTQDLMETRFTPDERAQMERMGYIEQPSAYSSEPYRITKALIEDGRSHCLFDGVIETRCPIHILQGGQDPDVPPAHALKLAAHLLVDPVVLSMIPDGDHRLSRPEDLSMLTGIIDRLIQVPNAFSTSER